MGFLRIKMTGVNQMKVQLDLVQSIATARLAAAAFEAANDIAQMLSDFSPRGAAGGPNPAGDAPGPLYASFAPQPSGVSTDTFGAAVTTDQPAKLLFVTGGTGEWGPTGNRIIPKTGGKKALYWQGADHPYKSVAGQKPNDFVTPVFEEADDVVRRRFEFAAEEILSVIV